MALEVLDHMRLVEDHVVPSLALEYMRVTTRERVRCNARVEMILVVPPLTEFLALLRVTVIAEHFEAGQELLKLHLPVKEHARRHDNQVWAPYSTVARQMS